MKLFLSVAIILVGMIMVASLISVGNMPAVVKTAATSQPSQVVSARFHIGQKVILTTGPKTTFHELVTLVSNSCDLFRCSWEVQFPDGTTSVVGENLLYEK